MTTREKIIVSLMCLTIFYGAIELLSDAGQDKARQGLPAATAAPEDLKAFVADISRKLITETVSPEYRYLVSRAGADWTKDPFINNSAPLSTKAPVTKTRPAAPTPVPEVPFSYSGFLSIGDKRLAIINGMEYAVGEALLEKGFVLVDITPQHAVIVRNGKDRLHLPLRDMD